MKKYIMSIAMLCLILLSACSSGPLANQRAAEPEAESRNTSGMDSVSTAGAKSGAAAAERSDGGGDQSATLQPRQPQKLGQEPPRYHSGKKVIYLTFDDGPSTATQSILDSLLKYGAQATFFMLEPRIRVEPNIVKRIVKEGHAPGLHGVTHDKNKFYESPQSAVNEMLKDQQTLENITGVHSQLIRTPYGSIPYLTEPFRAALKQQGFQLWDWNVDSSDWSNGQYLTTTIHQIQKQTAAGIIPIVLMHDKPETAEHLPELLKYLEQNGFAAERMEQSTTPYNFTCYNRCYPVA
ncbi:polysaccharide deacetylase family protein [Paenibacillus sp. XY044]|uniref:polysaccharide deacetylase family protein n=1 Tax=Paenibacillus sp. XY044 TaxID=2026089 RepID=UPI000B980377|nr:polysaccharide deacetylase family protein [Paenibacillus sp. XY044]OZB92372.1 hypothetical protein CJP46_25975 [Paenibacillus sp. XY044]